MRQVLRGPASKPNPTAKKAGNQSLRSKYSMLFVENTEELLMPGEEQTVLMKLVTKSLLA